jgi:hypothetical protein
MVLRCLRNVGAAIVATCTVALMTGTLGLIMAADAGVGAGGDTGAAVSFFTQNLYQTATCTGLFFSTTYGLDICVRVSASNNAKSMLYAFNSNLLTQTYFMDASCSTANRTVTLFDLSGVTLDECDNDAVIYSTSSAYVPPNVDGMLTLTYGSESNCASSSDMFYATWTADYDVPDDMAVDDFSETCTREAVAFDDDYAIVTSNTTAYQTKSLTRESSSSSSSKASCFAGSESVVLETGTTIPISSVKLGDRILTTDITGRNARFSEVVLLPHPKNDIRSAFLRLATSSGADIKVTADHLLLSDPRCDGSGAVLVRASDLVEGMCLMGCSHASQALCAAADPISSISSVESFGLYTVITEDELVVVNGIIASPFAINHSAAHSYYTLMRALFRCFPHVWRRDVFIRATAELGNLLAAVTKL